MAENTSPSLISRAVITEALGFAEVGRWTIAPCETKLDCSRPTKTANELPSTYLIASLANESATILYVGKSSDGWRLRRGPHLQNRDREFHRVILDELRAGRDVAVFERPAGWAQHDGFFASTNDAEEMALIARFNPRINKSADYRRATRFQALAAMAVESAAP